VSRSEHSSWLVTGAGGMLGQDLLAVLAAVPGVQVTGATRADLDITRPEAVAAAVGDYDIVVNAAGWTDVDGAETPEGEAAAAAVNAAGVHNLAAACAARSALLLHVSSDYVFDGSATMPYPEHARTGPLNAYGRTKLLGEQAVTGLLPSRGYVVRTAWLYGEHGKNFPATMLRLAAERPTIDVVQDQRGQPTWSLQLAGKLAELGRAALRGHHLVRPGPRGARAVRPRSRADPADHLHRVRPGRPAAPLQRAGPRQLGRGRPGTAPRLALRRGGGAPAPGLPGPAAGTPPAGRAAIKNRTAMNKKIARVLSVVPRCPRSGR
jgi:dTDP-4-dehydrorhamnose reductase